MNALFSRLLEELDVQRERLERCLARLPEDAIWRRPREELNSIGNLCLHLAGNESHYIGCGIGDSGYRRDRPAEFNTERGLSAGELVERLRRARETTRDVLAALRPEDLDRPVHTDHPENATVLTVLLHVFEHYAFHTGQVVLLTRLLQEGNDRLLEWGH